MIMPFSPFIVHDFHIPSVRSQLVYNAYVADSKVVVGFRNRHSCRLLELR